MKKTIFSGIQPSGNLHLGNYLGAITQWVEMQAENKCIFCVVDYHAITVKQDPKALNRQILDTVKVYLASGIDTKKSVIFQQSDIKEHTELGWVLNCIANNGELKRMTQFKDKAGLTSIDNIADLFANQEKLMDSANEMNATFSKRKIELAKVLKGLIENSKNIKSSDIESFEKLVNDIVVDTNKVTEKYYREFLEKVFLEEYKSFNQTTLGLFDYPVLMAADILLYNTDVVPVGDDQVQHVELTRILARRFNKTYGEVFRMPKVELRKEGARIMGLDDPTKKMSKSASSEYNYINLTDEPDVAKKKIMKAVADSESVVKYDVEKKPGISNFLTIYSLLKGVSVEKLEKQYAGKGYGDFKKDLAEVVAEFLTGFQERFNKISDEEALKVLALGAKEIQPIAQDTMTKVKQSLGIKK